MLYIYILCSPPRPRCKKDAPRERERARAGDAREDGKEMRVPYSTQIYPPPVLIDNKLLPPLELGQAYIYIYI